MNELPNNSHKFRSSLGEGEQRNDIQTRERPKPILSPDEMAVDKPSVVRSIFYSVVTNNWETAKHDILYDVVLPSFQDGIYNILQSALAIMFGRRYSPSGSRTNYNSISKTTNSYSNYYQNVLSQEDEDNIYRFETRKKADEILTELKELRSRYPFVKVADIYDLAGKTAPVSSFRWGWYDLSTAKIMYDSRDKVKPYILQMPKPRPLD